MHDYKHITLLYAEDEVQTRINHVLYLKAKYNFTIIEASDGEEALALFHTHKPDIVMSDITMPKMDGLSFIKEIRKNSLHTKIIILTAHTEHDKLIDALGMNVVNYLVKPINRKALVSAIDIALETLPQKLEVQDSSSTDDVAAKLSKSEHSLYELFKENYNTQISSLDIFNHIWEDKEYSSESVRTLVKKLRKKLSKESIENIYGGFYIFKK